MSEKVGVGVGGDGEWNEWGPSARSNYHRLVPVKLGQTSSWVSDSRWQRRCHPPPHHGDNCIWESCSFFVD